jgi:hypothetical protein
MSDPVIVVVSETQTRVVDSIRQGPPGPPGVGFVSITAGQELSGHRIVSVNEASLAIYADKDSLETVQQVLGLTTGAVSSGAVATVLPAGEITEPSWSMDPRAPVYLGNNGLLTQVLPTTGAILQIGVPLTATRLLVNIKMPIIQM